MLKENHPGASPIAGYIKEGKKREGRVIHGMGEVDCPVMDYAMVITIDFGEPY